jgi:hypothetical protein
MAISYKKRGLAPFLKQEIEARPHQRNAGCFFILNSHLRIQE